jgi:hypothetical protein
MYHPDHQHLPQYISLQWSRNCMNYLCSSSKDWWSPDPLSFNFHSM